MTLLVLCQNVSSVIVLHTGSPATDGQKSTLNDPAGANPVCSTRRSQGSGHDMFHDMLVHSSGLRREHDMYHDMFVYQSGLGWARGTKSDTLALQDPQRGNTFRH